MYISFGTEFCLEHPSPFSLLVGRGLASCDYVLSGNWVGKSSDFTNPFVCGPAGGKVKKMSSVCVTYVDNNTHTKIPNCSNLRAGLRGVVRTERLSFLFFSHKN